MKNKSLENILRTGDNTDNQHFLYFLQCLLTILPEIVCRCFEFGQVKNLLHNEGLKLKA